MNIYCIGIMRYEWGCLVLHRKVNLVALLHKAGCQILLPPTTVSGISFVASMTGSLANFSLSTASLERYSSTPM